MDERASLATAEIQASLIAEALLSASVGFLVWDDDRRYIAANECACRILGTTLEKFLGQRVGAHTKDGERLVDVAIATERVASRATVAKFDGSGQVEVFYVTFSTKTAGMPFMATLVWET
jgi:PAS domain-containing protein